MADPGFFWTPHRHSALDFLCKSPQEIQYWLRKFFKKNTKWRWKNGCKKTKIMTIRCFIFRMYWTFLSYSGHTSYTVDANICYYYYYYISKILKNKMYCKLTKTTFVSSSSAWTLVIASASLGFWLNSKYNIKYRKKEHYLDDLVAFNHCILYLIFL